MQVCSRKLSHKQNIFSLLQPRLVGLVQRVAREGVLSASAMRGVQMFTEAFHSRLTWVRSHAHEAEKVLPELLQEAWEHLVADERPLQRAGFALDQVMVTNVNTQISAAASEHACKCALEPLLREQIEILPLEVEAWGSVVDCGQVSIRS